VILLKRKWYQMMRRGLLTLSCHGVIGGNFFREIDSNEYFLIEHSFDFFNIYFIAELEDMTVLLIFMSPVQGR